MENLQAGCEEGLVAYGGIRRWLLLDDLGVHVVLSVSIWHMGILEDYIYHHILQYVVEHTIWFRPLLTYIQVASAHLPSLLEKGRLRVLDQHLDVLVKPRSSDGRPLHSALAVALTTGLNPSQGVDVGVVPRGATRRGSEASGRDIAPVTPLLPGTSLCYPALVDDEPRRLYSISMCVHAAVGE